MREVIDGYKPDVILLAAGADGIKDSPLGEANYSYDGFAYAAAMVADAAEHCEGRVLIGGADGYQPLDHTSRSWANVVEDIYLDPALLLPLNTEVARAARSIRPLRKP